MCETSFLSRAKNTKVVAMKGSQNVWSKSISVNFHLSVVACGRASGHVIPSLFILPGQRVPRNLMDCYYVAGSRLTCTDSGFINRATFLRWVDMFLDSGPTPFPAHFCCSLTGTYRTCLSIWSKWEKHLVPSSCVFLPTQHTLCNPST